MAYNPKRSRNIFNPNDTKPFKISRAKIESFIKCPRCFYMDRRLGVGRPPQFPFNLNIAVDALLKNEFDIYRVKGLKHPLIEEYDVDAKPAPHKDLDKWRQNFTGIQYLDNSTNLLIHGAIDDLWINTNNEYIVVDYKSTSKKEKITNIDQDWQITYKRQMEIYQWLLRKNNYSVLNTGYFVYCNGLKDRDAFNEKLEFDVTLISYEGNDSWIDKTVSELHSCLLGDQVPAVNGNCEFCAYRDAVENVLNL